MKTASKNAKLQTQLPSQLWLTKLQHLDHSLLNRILALGTWHLRIWEVEIALAKHITRQVKNKSIKSIKQNKESDPFTFRKTSASFCFFLLLKSFLSPLLLSLVEATNKVPVSIKTLVEFSTLLFSKLIRLLP